MCPLLKKKRESESSKLSFRTSVIKVLVQDVQIILKN